MPTLGNKHECFKCEAKFYDLGRSEIVCPSCGTDQAEADADDESASTKSAPKAVAKRAAKKAPAEEEAPAEKEVPTESKASPDAKTSDKADPSAPDDEADEFAGEEEDDEDLLDDD